MFGCVVFFLRVVGGGCYWLGFWEVDFFISLPFKKTCLHTHLHSYTRLPTLTRRFPPSPSALHKNIYRYTPTHPQSLNLPTLTRFLPPSRSALRASSTAETDVWRDSTCGLWVGDK